MNNDRRKRNTGLLLRRVLLVLLLGVFLFSGYRLLSIWQQYRTSAATYDQAAARYTRPVSSDPEGSAPEKADLPPVQVDFGELTAANPDIIGWICCEGTNLSYPVVFGRDNDYYLHRDYLGNDDFGGTIFSDKNNSRGFSDSNVILYGHNMRNGTMFGMLKDWLDPSYYEQHPKIWLLTPEGDFRIELFSGYFTTADSSTYTVFHEAGPELDAYLKAAEDRSVFETDTDLDPGACYIVLSTCSRNGENARTVLHGKLVPAK